MTNLYSEAEKRLEELQQIAKNKEAALAQAPSGKIRISKNRNRYQFYLRDNPQEKNGRYIPKANAKLIKTYAQKQYDEKILSTVRDEIEKLNNLLNDGHYDRKIQEVFSKMSDEVKEYVIPVDYSAEDAVKKWRAMQQKATNQYPFNQDIVFETKKGERVRSKSEVNIANALADHNIPYKYEFPLQLKNRIIYPDFTIWNEKKRQECYWEHRGMMDNFEYSRHSVEKVKDYNKNNIFVGDNLIITEETTVLPLGTDEIERIIKHYFI